MTGTDALTRRFRDAFGGPAGAVLVRSPGRVNLIGEHIDYNGLPVLPMAIQRSVCILARPRPEGDATLDVRNVDPTFGDRSFVGGPEIDPFPPGDWGNYLKAAARMLWRRHGGLRGIDAVLASDLPPAAGLSSSSALVTAAALALLGANGLPIDRQALMEELAEAERYVGTRGGGMDQAICLAGGAGHAALVEFAPVRVTHVAIPEGWRFLVASSLERAEKSGSAQATYNRRTRECREALESVARALGESAGATYPGLVAARRSEALLEVGEQALEDPWSRRYRHVIGEAERVRAAVTALREHDRAGFGSLMDASHASLRGDYEVSTPPLDALVTMARAAGADGARLTGAGLGGYALILCCQETMPAVRNALVEGFFWPRGVSELDDLMFEVRASGGATMKGGRGEAVT